MDMPPRLTNQYYARRNDNKQTFRDCSYTCIMRQERRSGFWVKCRTFRNRCYQNCPKRKRFYLKFVYFHFINGLYIYKWKLYYNKMSFSHELIYILLRDKIWYFTRNFSWHIRLIPECTVDRQAFVSILL